MWRKAIHVGLIVGGMWLAVLALEYGALGLVEGWMDGAILAMLKMWREV